MRRQRIKERKSQLLQKKAKVKTKMGLKESAQFLASSKYTRLLATLPSRGPTPHRIARIS